jgi:hypothetical protein
MQNQAVHPQESGGGGSHNTWVTGLKILRTIPETKPPLFSAEHQNAPSYIIFTIFSKVFYVISMGTTSQVYQTASMILPSRHRDEIPYPTMGPGQNADSRSLEGRLWRVSVETFSVTCSNIIQNPNHVGCDWVHFVQGNHV